MNAPSSIRLGAYLEAYLRPLAAWLARPDVTDIYVNGPGSVWLETLGGGSERHDAPELGELALWRLAVQIAASTHQAISREHPILSASLPDGARVQIIAPPATRSGLVMAIRKQAVHDLGLDDYAALGAFADTATDARHDEAELELRSLLARRELPAFFRLAIRLRRNILISGGTSTGKTTFLNALMREIPPDERLVSIEDTPEVQLERPNAVGLIAVRGGQGEASVGTEDLLQATLRLRPDRIILGELRGAEAFSFLRAVNSGHPGSITTVHADNPAAALDQIALMVMLSGAAMGRAEVRDYVSNVIDISVQLVRTNGRRRVSEIRLRERA
ncbi:MAG: P-type DNA transfer ATPase VirB11 [Pseudomonadota bacterium]